MRHLQDIRKDGINLALAALPEDARSRLEGKSRRQRADLIGRWQEELLKMGYTLGDVQDAIAQISE